MLAKLVSGKTSGSSAAASLASGKIQRVCVDEKRVEGAEEWFVGKLGRVERVPILLDEARQRTRSNALHGTNRRPSEESAGQGF